MSLPQVPLHLKDAVEKRLHDCLALFRQAGVLLPVPKLLYDIRGVAGGQAVWPDYVMRLNPVLLIEHPEHIVGTTVGHELAHLAAHHRYGPDISPHGKQWQRMMQVVGQPPLVTHSLDVSNVSTQKNNKPFSCACQVHWLSTRRQAKHRRGAVYVCQKCGAALAEGEVLQSKGASSSPRRKAETPSKSKRPPSVAMVTYAAELARKLRISAPAQVLNDFLACATFIDKCRAALGATASPAPSVDSAPTEKQLAFAKSIALRKRLKIPAAALSNRAAMSRWIGEHAMN